MNKYFKQPIFMAFVVKVSAIFCLMPLSFYVKSEDALALYGSDYVNERFQFHTQKFSSIDIPRGERLRIAYYLEVLEGTIDLEKHAKAQGGEVDLISIDSPANDFFYKAVKRCF